MKKVPTCTCQDFLDYLIRLWLRRRSCRFFSLSRPRGIERRWLWSSSSSDREACSPRKDTSSIPSSCSLLFARWSRSRPCRMWPNTYPGIRSIWLWCRVSWRSATGKKDGTCTSLLWDRSNNSRFLTRTVQKGYKLIVALTVDQN